MAYYKQISSEPLLHSEMENENKRLQSNTKQPLLVAVGCLNIDLLIQVPHLPGSDGRLVAPFAKMLGGMSGNVACTAASLGDPWPMRVELIAAIGSDPDGQWVEKELNAKGVNTKWLDRTSTTRTLQCIVLVEPDAKRSIIAEPGKLNYSRVGERLDAGGDLRGMGLMHVDGYHGPGVFNHFAQARVQGWRTSLDVDELLPEFLRDKRFSEIANDCFDVIFINQACAKRLLNSDDMSRWQTRLSDLAKQTNTLFLLTLGNEGAVVFVPNAASVSVPALVVEAVDTTGAGDVFAGVFLSCWLHGLKPADAAKRAVAGAALATTEIGALGFLPSGGAIQAMAPA